MKKTILTLTVATLAVMAGARGARAAQFEALEFLAGMAAAWALHEGGHVLAAELGGAPISWSRGSGHRTIGFVERGELGANTGAALYGAGLATQIAAGEIILGSPAIDQNSSFARGLMLWNVACPLRYAVNYLTRRSQGDLAGFAHYAGQERAQAFAAALAAASLNQGMRFAATQHWAPRWIKETAGLLFAGPTAGGGLQVGFAVRF